MNSQTDEKLMEMYQGGNDAAFRELYARRRGVLLHYVTNILNGSAPSLAGDAGDILQDVFAWIHAYRGRFIGGTMVMPWLFTTARRLTRNHVKHECRQRRDKRRVQHLYEDYVPDRPGDRPDGQSDEEPIKRGQFQGHYNCLAVECPDRNEAREEVAKCLGRLPPEHQEVVRLRYFIGHTAQEIADTLHLAKSTVDWRLRESLALMRHTEIEADAAEGA
jgi:RNA polymerase sigma factor (sigma-70 family)